MDESDMEILGIPVERKTSASLLGESKSHRMSVREKLRETEVYHHRTASKRSHQKKKRRKSRGEHKKRKTAREAKTKSAWNNEFQKHVRRAKEISTTSKADNSMATDPTNRSFITQSRITTYLGIYNKAKQSDKISRDVQVPPAVRSTARDGLQHILDVSEANIPPAPNPDTPHLLDDVLIETRSARQSTPKAQLRRPVPAATHKCVSHVKEAGSAKSSHHCDAAMETDCLHVGERVDPRFSSSPESSPVSEAADMIHSSFSLSTIFPGRGYFAEIKNTLQKQLKKQKASAAIQTPRKTMPSSKHHSSVRKNLAMDFSNYSGTSTSKSGSTSRSSHPGSMVKRSDFVARGGGVPRSHDLAESAATALYPLRQDSRPSAAGSHHLPPAAPGSSGRVNLFQECALTLQHQPLVNTVVEEDFFPNVETRVLPEKPMVDIMDYIYLSDGHDSLSHPESHPVDYDLLSASTSNLSSQSLSHGHSSILLGKPPRIHKGGAGCRWQYLEECDSSSGDSPLGRIYTLPPPPPTLPLPPSSPSPPAMFRHRLY
ncbi:uncharacterized protein [Diadema setosum]|uniref:uncharacterized protein n=1 Tax=Diadema setosum TaxID=31175 RepID=UPI003B3AEB91